MPFKKKQPGNPGDVTVVNVPTLTAYLKLKQEELQFRKNYLRVLKRIAPIINNYQLYRRDDNTDFAKSVVDSVPQGDPNLNWDWHARGIDQDIREGFDQVREEIMTDQNNVKLPNAIQRLEGNADATTYVGRMGEIRCLEALVGEMQKMVLFLEKEQLMDKAWHIIPNIRANELPIILVPASFPKNLYNLDAHQDNTQALLDGHGRDVTVWKDAQGQDHQVKQYGGVPHADNLVSLPDRDNYIQVVYDLGGEHALEFPRRDVYLTRCVVNLRDWLVDHDYLTADQDPDLSAPIPAPEAVAPNIPTDHVDAAGIDDHPADFGAVEAVDNQVIQSGGANESTPLPADRGDAHPNPPADADEIDLTLTLT